ncbi:hypothetical protein C4580_02620 [Candidatus Woesearchaeota archaeon]|nr:MAG: hypothetical protein C4580_02620 [Candidatus Woesearchaeota archaeon]
MSFIISNFAGSFGVFDLASRFSGVFMAHQGKVFRTIAAIEPKERQNWAYGGQEVKAGALSLFFAYRLPAFFYQGREADVLLDCREIFDNRQWGRNYQVQKEKDVLLVRFEKRDDHREVQKGEYSLWLAFAGASFDVKEEWVEQKGMFDEARQSPPSSRWVFRLGKASGSFVMASAQGRDDAVKLAKSAWQSRRRQEAELREWAQKQCGGSDAALACARLSLASLHGPEGLYAGLPWFCQRWARDELISLRALVLMGDAVLAKSIVLHHLSQIQPSGRLVGTMTRTIADAGWLFVRLLDFWPKLSKRERDFGIERLEYFVSESERSLRGGLVMCNVDETWMDSILRGGARIEINALLLAALRVLRVLKKKHPLEQQLKARVREAFLRKQRGGKGVYLADGAQDETIRPNVFIAAYVYPELLSKEEWISVFDFTLGRLWCEWGGLATIDRQDTGFVDAHSGEKPHSYHQGDSWFWINNLAALVLARTDRKRYAKYIDAIVKASAKEMREMGAIGHHAELSSAKELRSEGALAQSWSAAMFIELCEELARKKS